MDQPQLQEAIPDSDGKCRILNAAYPLFVEHGYKSVSMQQIADAARIHKATLYHHFLNKDAIFTAVVRMALRQVRTQVTEVIAAGGCASGQLALIALQMFDNTQSDIGRLMTDVHEHLPISERIELMKGDAHPWDLYEQIFSNAIQSAELPAVDTTLATSMFIGLVHGQAWSRKIGRIEEPLDQRVARLIVDTLFAGLRNADPQFATASRPPSRSDNHNK